MPILGSVGGEESKLNCRFEDMRPAYRFFYAGESRGEWCYLPKKGEADVLKDQDGHPLKVEVAEGLDGPET